METQALEKEAQEIARDECWQQEIREKKHKGLWWKILLWVLGLLLVAGATAAVLVWKVNMFQLRLAVNGSREMVLEYGQSFEDPGVLAQFSGTLFLREPQTVEVAVEGAVEPSALGTYELTYTARHTLNYYIGQMTFTESAVRRVCVKDTQVPVITLTANPDGYTVPGQPYAEEGFAATDNYDGDITDQVTRTEQDGKVYYSVTDSSGNRAEAVREIVYHDPEGPVLTLTGGTDVSITQGSAYREPGYSAVDNCDGDITNYVTVTGSVDTNTVGVYTLEYCVTDSYKNTTKVTRTVRVNAPAPLPPIPEMPAGDAQTPVTPNGKVIYLTFDDGPNIHTERLLDILDMYGVKATFFVVKTGYLHLLPRMVSSGHTVAVHSATHNYGQIYSSENAYFNDLYDMQSTIASYTGVTPTILRFPGGSSNTVSSISPGIMTRLTATLREMGYRYFDWNVDSRDAGGATSADSVYWNVINGCSRKNVSIVLQHDTKGYSVDAVERIIQWGLVNGYTFLPLDASSPVCEHDLNN